MSTSYQVDLVFGTRQADSQLARMEQRLRALERAGGAAGGRDTFGPMGNSAQAATGKIDMLVGGLRAFAALGVVTAAGAMATAIFKMGVQAEATEVRVRGLTAGLDDYERFQEVARTAADKFGLSQQAAQAGLAQTYARLRPLGFTLSEVRDVYEGFNTAARNGGSTAQESEGAFRQLAQALGSGALRGDEFNSIMEQTPAIGIEVARVMGINAGQLREMAAEGKLTGDIVLKALQNIRTEGAEKLDASLNTTGANVEKLKNRFIDMGTAVGSGAMPPILRTLQALNLLLDQATKNAGSLGFALQQALAVTGNPLVGIGTNAFNLLQRVPGGRQVTGYFGEMLGYTPEKETFGPFMPEGMEQRYRIQEQTRIREEKAAKEAAKKGGSKSGPTESGAMQELLRRIRSGEGTYTSINRGRAGDTPGGMQRLTSMSIAEVMAMQQRGQAFAVGAYQFIPDTLKGAVQRSGIDPKERFSPQVQDKLAMELILGGAKRPGLAAYLTGRGGSLSRANDEIASEWAALKGSGGRGKYDGDSAGNKASISVKDLLPLVRKEVMGGGALGDDLAQGQFESRQKAEEERRLQQERLVDSRRQLAILERQADVARASDAEERVRAQADLARTERMYKYVDLLKEAKTEEERGNVARAQGLEIQRQELDLAQDLARVEKDRAERREAALRPRQDRIAILEATLRGPDAVRTLERDNAIGEMGESGVDPGEAGALYDREKALERQIVRQQELNALWEEGGRTLGGLFADLVRGTDDWQASLTRALESLASVLLEAGLRGFAENNQGGFLSGLISQVLGSFDGGGYTGSGSRTGGLDGKGGFVAMLHPNETVVDHTRGQAVGGGAVNVGGITVNVATDGNTKVGGAGGGELARGIQAAVTAEILRQRRPGGVLAGG